MCYLCLKREGRGVKMAPAFGRRSPCLSPEGSSLTSRRQWPRVRAGLWSRLPQTANLYWALRKRAIGAHARKGQREAESASPLWRVDMLTSSPGLALAHLDL
ncbi:unnamed protein product [Prorocentrum cordatum]|uniref:Uncharacterized protein n=1 Tax=Prorocentrum cordatum TaxID=2364126 RepID=A0ABN9SHF1_9DINO|nr:unnamed protein product [Polarella glacialis]